MATDLSDLWTVVLDTEEGRDLERELQRELAEGHVLTGREVRAVAARKLRAHSGDFVHPVRGFRAPGLGGRVAADVECGLAPVGHLLRFVERQFVTVPVMFADVVGR